MARDVEALILSATTSCPSSFPRLPAALLRTFCTDISLVGLGIRTAYLLDSFSFSEADARGFAAALRTTDPLFKDVRLLFHERFEQVLFVNVLLLQDRVVEARSESRWTAFIRLTPEPRHTYGTPPDIVAACQSILDASAQPSSPVDKAISSLTASQMIALAGFLLEYPLSYFPTEAEWNSFLHDVPLHVFECWLEGRNAEEHSFMKFSCPSGCLNAGEGEHTAMSARIKQRFEGRLGSETGWTGVRVNCEARTLERVAL